VRHRDNRRGGIEQRGARGVLGADLQQARAAGEYCRGQIGERPPGAGGDVGVQNGDERRKNRRRGVP
jgi:hypothetical protein